MNPTHERISIVVPIYNESKFIGKCLDALLKLSGASLSNDYEIIVVDDGSSDNSAEVVSNYPVRIIRLTKNCGKIIARKTGAEQASYNTILFIDAKVEASEDILKQYWSLGYSPLIAGRQLELEKTMTPTERLFFLIRRRYYYPYFPLNEKEGQVFITKNNFRRIPKGTTCLFIEKDLFFRSIPEVFTKNTNDDIALIENIVFRENIKILKHRNIKIHYSQREDSKELSSWVLKRGVTFFDFYIKRNMLYRIAALLPVTILFFIAYAAFGQPMYLASAFLAFLLIYFFAVFSIIEKKKDILIVTPLLWKYLIMFYLGILKGWLDNFKSFSFKKESR